jgi:histidinol-phosphatase
MPNLGTGRYQREIEIGCEIARNAGRTAMEYRSRGVGVESKSDDSPVTIADRECEKLIVAALRQAFPDDGLLGEEGAAHESASGRRWIIDPIDGTRDFIRGTKAWSVLIGLEDHDEVVAGFAYFPSYDELFYAAKGAGSWWVTGLNAEPVRIHAARADKLSDALVCINGLSYMHRYPFGEDLVEWMAGTWTVRSMGGCVDAMLVASGRADVWLEAQAKPWDLAPLKIIAEEAGAVTFDFEGRATIYGGNFVITVPALADELKRFVGKREETA